MMQVIHGNISDIVNSIPRHCNQSKLMNQVIAFGIPFL